jgi:hypothetical protein
MLVIARANELMAFAGPGSSSPFSTLSIARESVTSKSSELSAVGIALAALAALLRDLPPFLAASRRASSESTSCIRQNVLPLSAGRLHRLPDFAIAKHFTAIGLLPQDLAAQPAGTQDTPTSGAGRGGGPRRLG